MEVGLNYLSSLKLEYEGDRIGARHERRLDELLQRKKNKGFG